MELKQKIETLINEVESTHRYSMSRIYSAYNEAFGTDETPQSCASCLIRKVKELKQWLKTQDAEQQPPKKKKSNTKDKA